MTTVRDRPAAASGTFRLGGDLPVHRLGFGAMQLTGPGVWGEPSSGSTAPPAPAPRREPGSQGAALMRVAVLGLGAMGSAIATRLLDAGYELIVWNRTPERADPLVGRGAGRAASPSQAASLADVVITSLSDDAAVRAVCLGENGAVHGIQADAILMDMSTVSPETSRMLAEAAIEAGFAERDIAAVVEAVRLRRAAVPT